MRSDWRRTEHVSTGFWGIPGTYRCTKVHVAVGSNRALCGRRFSSRCQYQWCAHGIHLEYLECPRCRVRAHKIVLRQQQQQQQRSAPGTCRRF